MYNTTEWHFQSVQWESLHFMHCLHNINTKRDVGWAAISFGVILHVLSFKNSRG